MKQGTKDALKALGWSSGVFCSVASAYYCIDKAIEKMSNFIRSCRNGKSK